MTALPPPPYLQYYKELFASWSCHTPLTGLLDPDPSLIDHPWDIRDLTCIPAFMLPKLEYQLGEQWGGGVQMYTYAFSKHQQKIHRMH